MRETSEDKKKLFLEQMSERRQALEDLAGRMDKKGLNLPPGGIHFVNDATDLYDITMEFVMDMSRTTKLPKECFQVRWMQGQDGSRFPDVNISVPQSVAVQMRRNSPLITDRGIQLTLDMSIKGAIKTHESELREKYERLFAPVETPVASMVKERVLEVFKEGVNYQCPSCDVLISGTEILAEKSDNPDCPRCGEFKQSLFLRAPDRFQPTSAN